MRKPKRPCHLLELELGWILLPMPANQKLHPKGYLGYLGKRRRSRRKQSGKVSSVMDEGGGGGCDSKFPPPLFPTMLTSPGHTPNQKIGGQVNSRSLHGICELWKHQDLSTPIRSACSLDFRAQYITVAHRLSYKVSCPLVLRYPVD